MKASKMHPEKFAKNIRMSFSKREEFKDMPNLIGIQEDSFVWFSTKGIIDVFKDINAKNIIALPNNISSGIIIKCASENIKDKNYNTSTMQLTSKSINGKNNLDKNKLNIVKIFKK